MLVLICASCHPATGAVSVASRAASAAASGVTASTVELESESQAAPVTRAEPLAWHVVVAGDAHRAGPPSLNDRVLALISEYPERGFGGYAWPSHRGFDGTSRELRLGRRVIARGGKGNHCVGMTFEVFWRAIESCAGGARGAFDARTARAFRLRWYVPDPKGTGPAEVLPRYQLGAPVALADARPGDFVQAWNRDGTFGHSMVFLGWERDPAGAITKIRYWSSQPWTEGIGTSDMPIGEDGFDPAHIYIARATCPRT